MEKLEDFDFIIRKLSIVTRQMKMISLAIFFTLVLNIIVFVLYYFSFNSKYSYGSVNFELTAIVVSFIGIMMILFHYVLKRRGQIYYEEIADEFEWGFKRNVKNDIRAPIGIRIRIKEYLRASELPLIPNQYGHIIYFILFLSMLILTIISRNLFLKNYLY